MPFVSIIILNWNGWKSTLECLESLYQISYSNYKVILVDNGSTDRSVEKIKRWIDQKKVKIFFILNKKNEGFVGGNNIAIEQILGQGKSEYILLLNNDTVVDKDFLTELIKVAENQKKVGIVGPKIYNYRSNKNGQNVIQSVGAKFNLFTGIGSSYGENQVDRKQFDEIRIVDYVCGACLLIKCSLIKKIGLLNQKLFVYFEDGDWCLKAKEKGYDVVCVPRSIIWHKGAESSSKMPEKIMYYRARNRFLTERRFAKGYQYSFFVFYCLLVMIPLWTFRSIVFLKRPGLMRYFFKGLKDGFVQ